MNLLHYAPQTGFESLSSALARAPAVVGCAVIVDTPGAISGCSETSVVFVVPPWIADGLLARTSLRNFRITSSTWRTSNPPSIAKLKATFQNVLLISEPILAWLSTTSRVHLLVQVSKFLFHRYLARFLQGVASVSRGASGRFRYR